MKDKITYKVILVLLLMIYSKTIFAQDDIEISADNYNFKIKGRFNFTLLQNYMVFDIEYDIVRINPKIRLKNTVKALLKDGSILEADKIEFHKTGYANHYVFIFKPEKPFNILLINNEEIDVSEIKVLNSNDLEYFKRLYLDYAKKELELLGDNNINSDSKLVDIKEKIDTAGYDKNEATFNEIKAYCFDYQKGENRNIKSARYYYDKSYEAGNRDSLFLKNYSRFCYDEALKLYKGSNISEDTAKLNDIIRLSEIVAKHYPQKNTDTVSNSNYMSAYALYFLTDEVDISKQGEFIIKISDHLSDIETNPNDVNHCKALLLLGNSYEFVNNTNKAMEYFNMITNAQSTCEESIKKIASEMINKINSIK